MATVELREIGITGIHVTPVAMGCWPIAGVTSLNVNRNDSLATLETAFKSGVNFFDTGHVYGYHGESEKLIADALKTRRDEIVIATKGGFLWNEFGKQARDGRPQTLRRQCEESLERLETDRVDLLYLHGPDPNVPISESAGALRELRDAGKTRAVGLCNANQSQLEEFAAECRLDAYQPHYNMLQREIEDAEAPWCVENKVSVMAYWPLMKGLLAGKLPRDHHFDPRDGRQNYPMFQGDEWQRNQDFVDGLRRIAAECETSVAEVVVNWTIHRPGITSALCGAKRAYQIQENAAAMSWQLTDEQTARINRAIEKRGPIVSRGSV